MFCSRQLKTNHTRTAPSFGTLDGVTIKKRKCFGINYGIPSGNLTYRKSLFSMGRLTINGDFSIAMSNYRREKYVFRLKALCVILSGGLFSAQSGESRPVRPATELEDVMK